MSIASDALTELDVTHRVRKRAQYEAFAFDVTDDGVQVENNSYAEPSEHSYLVRIEEGVPIACDCPADDAYAGACKHRVAVAIRMPVLRAATRVATDGGVVADHDESATDDTTTSDSERPDDCDCAELRDDFPCFPCFAAGRKDLPDE